MSLLQEQTADHSCLKDSGPLGGHAWEASMEEAAIHSGSQLFKVAGGSEIVSVALFRCCGLGRG